ncbi:hypothetical protein [Mesomycoplasma lagogenitalium]|uniref:Uncharacterized protein n=1 Tax=Mesomycoplasma lagogenitalium TaxID=171286 RepID=A0ABY8LVC1_9BACT|nr:hypothetical protein [Mesomycoplasma lagogenitalium]WGI36478.1 hypothetical protein QEG99_03365 [Mesomycoplasma lagogenitalium]
MKDKKWIFYLTFSLILFLICLILLILANVKYNSIYEYFNPDYESSKIAKSSKVGQNFLQLYSKALGQLSQLHSDKFNFDDFYKNVLEPIENNFTEADVSNFADHSGWNEFNNYLTTAKNWFTAIFSILLILSSFGIALSINNKYKFLTLKWKLVRR